MDAAVSFHHTNSAALKLDGNALSIFTLTSSSSVDSTRSGGQQGSRGSDERSLLITLLHLVFTCHAMKGANQLLLKKPNQTLRLDVEMRPPAAPYS